MSNRERTKANVKRGAFLIISGTQIELVFNLNTINMLVSMQIMLPTTLFLNICYVYLGSISTNNVNSIN